MYTDHFGFTEPPFENNLDQRFLFLSKDHKEVLAALLFFIKENRPFAIICGDVGTGKTMVLTAFIDRLPASHHPIFISNPLVEYRDILHYVAQTLKIDNPGREVLPLIDKVKEALIAAREKGHCYFLVIDEAHLLSDRSLDDIRLLSNIETRDRKLLQVLLVGQYELSHKLRRPEMRQLRQRISVNRFLSSLDSEETLAYIEHRLKLVGSKFSHCFSPDCLPLIFSLTDGVPRQINHLCDSAFLIAKVEGRKKVTKDILRKTDETLKSDLVLTPQARSYKDFARSNLPTPRRLLALASSAVGLGALVLFLAYFVMTYRLGHQFPLFSPRNSPVVASPSPAATTTPHPVPPAESTITTAATQAVASPPALSQPTDGPTSTHLVSEASLAPASSPPVEPQRASQVEASLRSGSPDKALPANVSSTSPEQGVEPQDSPSTPPSSPPARKIIVRDGDTLVGIASRFFPHDRMYALRALLAVNPGIRNRNLIYPGQAIILPKLPPGHSPAPPLASASQGPFAIQLAQVFDSGKAVAEVYARHLQERGYSTSLSEIPSPQGRVAYALRIGTYETEQAALEAAAAFERAEHALCVVLSVRETNHLQSGATPGGTGNASAPSLPEDRNTPTSRATSP